MNLIRPTKSLSFALSNERSLSIRKRVLSIRKREEGPVFCYTLAFMLTACSSVQETSVKESEFIDLKSILPNATYDIRYFSRNNFVGQPITGYLAPKCIIHIEAAKALKAVNNELEKQKKRLKIFDCYRPQRAVAHFMAWVDDKEQQQTKAQYYPNLTKPELKGDYIAERSGHSRGYTVDLTIEQQQNNGTFKALDMGSAFDLFDSQSNTLSPQIRAQQTQNRLLLRDLMLKHNFSDYSMEWWHFTHSSDPRNRYLDFDVK